MPKEEMSPEVLEETMAQENTAEDAMVASPAVENQEDDLPVEDAFGTLDSLEQKVAHLESRLESNFAGVQNQLTEFNLRLGEVLDTVIGNLESNKKEVMTTTNTTEVVDAGIPAVADKAPDVRERYAQIEADRAELKKRMGMQPSKNSPSVQSSISALVGETQSLAQTKLVNLKIKGMINSFRFLNVGQPIDLDQSVNGRATLVVNNSGYVVEAEMG